MESERWFKTIARGMSFLIFWREGSGVIFCEASKSIYLYIYRAGGSGFALVGHYDSLDSESRYAVNLMAGCENDLVLQRICAEIAELVKLAMSL